MKQFGNFQKNVLLFLVRWREKKILSYLNVLLLFRKICRAVMINWKTNKQILILNNHPKIDDHLKNNQQISLYFLNLKKNPKNDDWLRGGGYRKSRGWMKGHGGWGWYRVLNFFHLIKTSTFFGGLSHFPTFIFLHFLIALKQFSI